MSIRFNMIGVFVTNLENMIGFYRDVFGLEVQQTMGSYAEFKHEGVRFAMFERAKLPNYLGQVPTYPSGLNGTFELAIDLPCFADVDSEFQRVIKAGAKAIMEPRDMPWGQRSCFVADPDDNLIEIGSFNEGVKNE